MSKNVKPEDLALEMEAISQACNETGTCDDEPPVLLARLVHGLSLEEWQKTCENYGIENWHAFPVNHETGKEFDKLDSHRVDSLPITPFREVEGALTCQMFIALLRREILRLRRTGGDMSILGFALSDKNRLVTALGSNTVTRLETLLGLSILSIMESCDALGMLREGQYVCSLPGMGQLAARNFAEKCQEYFLEAARPYFPTGGISAGHGADCSIGIINILNGEQADANDLLNRAKSCLEIALSREDGHIYQEAAAVPLKNTTLVQSSEKRFLFFGG